MRSMTGFGNGVAENEEYKVVVELKSVNGKFLDINAKVGRQYLEIEEEAKKIIRQKLNRGSVDLFMFITNKVGGNNGVQLDKVLAKDIVDINNNIAQEFSLQNNLSAKDLLRFDGVLSITSLSTDVSAIMPLVEESLNQALDKIIKMQEQEGEKMKADLKEKIDRLNVVVNNIKDFAPKAIEEYGERLKQRIAEALGDIAIEESKFLNEIAYYVDKTDINEEITRLYSHIEQFNNLLKQNEPVGKRLEFLSQEITREVNTTGSKANNITLTGYVLEAKNIVETIKEQIRNVE